MRPPAKQSTRGITSTEPGPMPAPPAPWHGLFPRPVTSDHPTQGPNLSSSITVIPVYGVPLPATWILEPKARSKAFVAPLTDRNDRRAPFVVLREARLGQLRRREPV